ncbi:MAG: tetratricopeptide repeat protein, partial [Planctomycetota bacterium]
VECANFRAIALVQLGRRDEAGGAIGSALSHEPDNPTTHANMGWTLLHQNKTKQALEHFREALRLDPNHEWAKQGIVEALKARNPIYRLMLIYFLWMSRLEPRVQWGVLIGGFILIRALNSASRNNPYIEPFTQPIIYLYIAFVLMAWTARPLFNLLLRLNRFGRYALSDDQVTATNWLGATIAVALVSGTYWLFTDAPAAGALATFGAAMAIPISGAFAAGEGKRSRKILLGYCLALIAVALWSVALFATQPPGSDAPHGVAGLFILGWIIYTWFANIAITAD